MLLAFPAGNLLIDTTPEMRIQLLRERVRRVHAIAFTHHHADHLFGLDDARLFPKWIGGPVPVFCEEETEDCIQRVFSYAFREGTEDWPRGVRAQDPVRADRAGCAVSRCSARRSCRSGWSMGGSRVLGFRIGDLAYCTDVNRIPEESWRLLEGLDTLILDALRFEPHPTHFSLERGAGGDRAAAAAADPVHPPVARLRPRDRRSHAAPPASLWPTMACPWISEPRDGRVLSGALA